MFHLFPRERQEWMRCGIFSAQAYIIIILSVMAYFRFHWPPHHMPPTCFMWFEQVYGLCCVGLLVTSFVELATNRKKRSFINFALSVIGFLGASVFPPNIVA
jgi:hypothetical protein